MSSSKVFPAIAAAVVVLSAQASVRVATRPVVSGKYDGAWTVAVDGAGKDFECSVFDMDGDLVAGPFVTSPFPVPEPKTWTAETPNCYRLVVRSTSGEDEPDEPEEVVFGFCTRHVKGGRLYVNGQPVRLKFAPKELNGNAGLSSQIMREDAFLKGVYALSGEEAVQVAHETALETPWATRHAFRDWSVKATNYFQRIVVANRNAFVGSDGVELRWRLFRDGREVDDGEVELRGIGPGQEALYDMPQEAVAAQYGEGTVSIRFEFVRDGMFVAEDQVDLMESREVKPLAPPPGFFAPSSVEFEASGRERVFTAGGVRLVYGDSDAFPSSFAKTGMFGGKTLFDGMRLCSEIIDLTDRADAKPRSPVEERAGALSFITFSDHKYGVGRGTMMPLSAKWTVYPNGIVSCRARLRQGDLQGRCGLVFSIPYKAPGSKWYSLYLSHPLPGEDVDVEWFGLGPRANGRDSSEGAFLGCWRTDATVPIRAEKTRGVRVGSLTVRTLGAPFAFSVEGAQDVKSSSDDGHILLTVYGESDAAGVTEFAFTLSADDSDLTARTE